MSNGTSLLVPLTISFLINITKIYTVLNGALHYRKSPVLYGPVASFIKTIIVEGLCAKMYFSYLGQSNPLML